jgi:hypothetical protein
MRNVRRLLLLAVLVLGLTVAGASPVSAQTSRVSGTAVSDTSGVCTDDVPSNFFDYPPLVMSGSLEGCWYTDVFWFKDFGHPGLYLEVGQEMFVGTVNGKSGSFTTRYVFEAKLGADGFEVSGQCQHPIVRGKDGLKGISGLILFTDIVDQATHLITFKYKGVVSL